MKFKGPHLTRRGVLLGGAATAVAGTAALVWPRGVSGTGEGASRGGQPGLRLIAATGTAPLLGASRPAVQVWSYNGAVPGPEIRLRQGERLRVVLENDLGEETTIHWRGVRLPNAMDGVPHLTQAPVRPVGRFTYDFVVPDAGTFWYHPHQRSFEQVGRGLYGPLIVEEPEPIQVDRDLTWVLDDWRLDGNGQISGGFGSRHDATMAGRIGNTVTINGGVPRPLDVRGGERIRLRLINAANARIFGLDFGAHRPVVIAVDGQPVSPYEGDGPLLLGPAMRIDLVLDMVGRPGSRVPVRDSFYPGLEYSLTSFVYAASPLRERPLATPVELRPNPLPEPDPRNAQRHEIVFGGGMPGMIGGMMAGGGMGNMNWTVNGVSATGHVHDPLFTIPRGRTSVLHLKNDTAWWHPVHLHGHSFRVLSRNGRPTSRREWQDTILIPPQETAEIAFVGDNPGDWMFHCHILEHQEAGMMATVRVS